jgi:hypothetical protein
MRKSEERHAPSCREAARIKDLDCASNILNIKHNLIFYGKEQKRQKALTVAKVPDSLWSDQKTVA